MQLAEEGARCQGDSEGVVDARESEVGAYATHRRGRNVEQDAQVEDGWLQPSSERRLHCVLFAELCSPSTLLFMQ